MNFWGIVNLLEKTTSIEEVERGKMLEGRERLGRIEGYATKFTPVISFHTRKRPCKMAQ
jgi:hypothetical protein